MCYTDSPDTDKQRQEMNTWEVKGEQLEFIEDGHIYVYGGIILPSITTILKAKFGGKYTNVSREVLQRASELGTQVHEAIEDYEKRGYEVDLKELRNWKFLKKAYGFKCIDNEVPVVLFDEGKPIACGRLDLVLEDNGKIGLGDIKRTSSLDKNYLAYQLNLYRLAYQQCYGQQIEFLKAVHLREDVRKYIDIPINEDFILNFIKEWRQEND